MTIAQSRKQVLVWSLAALAACVAFILSQGLVLQLYGYVSWTGVTAATIGSILNIILTGASIWTAVAAVVGAFAAGPIVAVFTQIGITAIKTWVKTFGFKAVVGF